jgi:tetratricopeptide (TPR) repeat protein
MPETDLLHLQELPSERLLEKVFGASFERLPDDSQHLLMALALFDAPATREAWQATARVPAQGFDFGIEGLKNWMLIEHDTVNDRYDLLAITKEFALKRLRDQSTDIAADLQRNRLNYYTEFTGVNGRNRRNHEKLVADWANVWQTVLVTTKQWEVASGSWPLSPDAHGVGNSIIVLANNLDMFCRERGYHQERLHLCKNAAKAADLLGLEEHLGPLAYSVGWILCDTQPDLRAAEDWAKWALGALERIGRGTGYALRLLARIERSRLASRLDKTMPEHERVNSYLSRATIAFMNDMDARGLARVYSDWGLFLFRTDEFRESLRKHRQALEMFEQEDDEAGIAHTQVNLGDVYVKMGQFDTAWPYYLRALDISRTSLLTQTAAESEHGLARVLLGKWSQSRDFQRRENLESARSRALAARDMFVKLAMHRELASVDLTIECIDSALAEQLKPVTERSDTMRSADADAYADLEIFVTKDGEVFVHSFQGERLGTISSDMLEEIKMVMDLIDEDRTSAQSLRNFGTNLYRMLFSLNVHTHFNQTEAAARVKGQGLRIRLTVEAGALSEIPWEFLFRQEGSYFLAADENMVLSHYVRIPQQLAPIAPDAGSLRMLLIVANPSDQVPLNPDDWDARVRKKLKEPIAQNKIAIETVKHATRQNIATAVMTHKPNIVQFVGHGVYDGNMGFLLLVNENTGKSWRVSDDTFRNMFRSVRTQLGLVSLVSCETAQGTPLRGFLGVAPKLVEMGVPAVVAMRYPISIAAAEVFLEEFYRAIADLRPVDWATQWARNQIGIAFGFDNREFATPVLFMRAKDGRIFA